MKRTAEFMAATAAAVLLASSGQAGEVRFAEIPMVSRVAPVSAVNEESRTITLDWSTGADVQRYDWWNGVRYIENLDVSEPACDLSRLNGGAPLLNSHYMYDLNSQLGVVERAWIENGIGKADVRFPAEGIDEDADKIFRKVKDKIIRNVSVGYIVRKYEITDNQGDGMNIYRAVDWQPIEISLVTIPADAGAGVRSESERMHACSFVRAAPASNKETEMPKPNEEAPATVVSADEQKRIADAAIAAERQRIQDIHARVTTAGLPVEVANDLIGRGIAAEHAGNHILDEMAKRGAKPVVPAGEGARITQDAREVRASAIEEALLHRFDPKRFALTDKGRSWRGMRMMEIAREVLAENGEKVRGMAPMEIATRAMMTTSDLPNILANIANKSLQAGYAAEIRTFTPFCTRRDVADFKQISSAQMGEGSNLEVVNEAGEFKRGAISDSAEKYALATYGKVFTLSRQMLINDDMSAFTRLPFMFGNAGTRLENDIVWAIITANASMADGTALFHANHGNLQTGGGSVLATAGLGVMRKQFRTQKGRDSKQTLNLMMKYIMVPASLETTLEQIMSPLLYASASSSIVVDWIKSLTPIVEARLDANSTTAWYGACDPAARPTIEYAYLEGQDGVYLETRDGFETDGTDFKVRHDFGAKAVDWLGLQKAAGA